MAKRCGRGSCIRMRTEGKADVELEMQGEVEVQESGPGIQPEIPVKATVPVHPTPRVQVQVVTYNSAAQVVECLQSVLAQSVQVERIVVLDNGSQDESVGVAAKVDGAIEVMALGQNRGYAAAHNLGFRQAVARGFDYVLTLNPDVVLEPRYLEWVLVSAGTDSLCGGVSGKLLRSGQGTDALVIDSVGLCLGSLLHVRDCGSMEWDVGQYDRAQEVWGVCGAAALYRVDMLRQVDASGEAFDATFFVYKEDVDLCWTAKGLGWRFLYQPLARAQHTRGWTRSNRPSAAVVAHSYANQMALLVKHVEHFSPTLAVAIVAEVTRFVLLLGTRPTAALQAVALMARNGSHMWQERARLRGQVTPGRWVS